MDVETEDTRLEKLMEAKAKADARIYRENLDSDELASSKAYSEPEDSDETQMTKI